MGRTSNHHYLPQCYLQGFARRENPAQIVAIEKTAESRHFTTAIRNTGAQRDYHTIEQADGTIDSQTVETELSKVEQQQCLLIRRIAERRKLTDQDFLVLAQFVSVMRLRVPAYKRYLEAQLASTAKAMGRMIAKDDRLEKVAESHDFPFLEGLSDAARQCLFDRMRKAVIEDAFEVTVTNSHLLSYIFELGFSPQIIEILGSMGVTFVTPPASRQFVTSDQPVALFNAAARPSDEHGAGLIDAGMELTLPLTASLLVKLDRSNRRGSRERASEAQVAEYNRRTIIMAERYIYAAQATDDILGTVKANVSHSAGSDFTMQEDDDSAFVFSRVVPVCPPEAYDPPSER